MPDGLAAVRQAPATEGAANETAASEHRRVASSMEEGLGMRLRGGVGEGADAIDRWLDRAYTRLGWRLPLVALGAICLTLPPLAAAGGLILVRVQSLSSADATEFVLQSAGHAVLASLLAVLFARRVVAPLKAWAAARGERSAGEAAWRAAQRIPSRFVLAMVLGGALVFPAGAIINESSVGALSLPFFIVTMLGVVGVFALVGCVVGFGIQIVLRPVMRDIASAVDPLPPFGRGVSVRLKLLVAVPLILTAQAMGPIVLATPPRTPWSEVLQRTWIVYALGIPFGFPAALLIAYSTVRPLEDLFSATKRLGRRDFKTRVPELSADEYGVLARSFNEAMEGLAERERFASENERLLDQVRASRARIVAASDAERRRIERNIHDGAQQQLVAHALELRMLQEIADTSTPEQLRSLLDAASANVEAALDELRELARGLHPSVLATDGLPPALRQLATRAPIPISVSAPHERFPEAIESTAYFIACEALANIAKYAHASTAEISVQRVDSRLVVDIADDGIGGADQNEGSGLAGLADRVAAVDGTLTVQSPAGKGTRIRAELPLEGKTG
jgi:signal transduction histidine kinase